MADAVTEYLESRSGDAPSVIGDPVISKEVLDAKQRVQEAVNKYGV
jgi:hypothetical protein